MESARAGVPVLRFYRWDPPCLSLGRNQRARGAYRGEAAGRLGVDVVRRPTGGRAVYHDQELTYAVTAPAGLWGGLRASYARLNAALRRGLAALGVEVSVRGEGSGPRAPEPDGRACFRDPLPGEVMAGGRKLVGSAQWRQEGALLQHGSILLRDQQHVVTELQEETRRGSAGTGDRGEPPRDRPGRARSAAALEDFLEPLPGPGRIVECLVRGFEEELGTRTSPGELWREELTRARALEERYAGEDWTWRR